ncbi:unnamed protein product [Urochloa humidicola]
MAALVGIAGGDGLQGPLLGATGAVSQSQDPPPRDRRRSRPWSALAIAAALLAVAGILLLLNSSGSGDAGAVADARAKVAGAGGAPRMRGGRHEVESGVGAAAADDARCSEVGAAALRAGGHAVDAAVAAALCLGVVHPMSSGLGGGAFVVVRDAASGDAVAFDARETAPAAATPMLNVLGGYKSLDFLKGFLGVHRLIEAIKHMLAIRMGLGDPAFVNVAGDVKEMLSPVLADKVRRRIVDNTTFPPGYYFPKWSQLDDHGTSHLCVVDGDRNAVAMTTTVNYFFGGKVLSPSTGIVLNNEMDDFSVPAERTLPGQLPPAPANFIAPGKRPLSSMTPLIILKDGQLAGVVGGSGGTNIIATVLQVFLNHFVVGMDPLAAVQQPRVYHKLIPNVVTYEDETVASGEVIALSEGTKAFLEKRGHQLQSTDSGAVCQFIVQQLPETPASGGGGDVFRGKLTAVSDPRKDGRPAGL